MKTNVVYSGTRSVADALATAETNHLGLKIIHGPMGWGWVYLQDLAERVRLSRQEVLTRFFFLSNWEDSPLPLWNFFEEEVTDDGWSVSDHNQWPKYAWFVPAGWANGVVEAAASGIARVVIIPHPEGHPPFQGGLRWTVVQHSEGCGDRHIVTAYAVDNDGKVILGGEPAYSG